MNKVQLAARGAKIELARRHFYDFCKLRAPEFYKDDRPYLKQICDEIQDFYYSDDNVLIINIGPRHGKSRTVTLLAQWVYGEDQTVKIMTGSYNETLSTTFSKAVRNGIQEEKADLAKIVYSDIFPGVRIKRGDGAMNLWSLEGGYNNYLATSPTGTATGFGANLIIIDDLIKLALEAYNDSVLEGHWDWFTNTMLSRLEEGGKIIIIMTRWSSKDLAGRALEHFRNEGQKVRHISLKTLQDDGRMLCSEILSRKSYDMKIRAMGADIASANYQQIPIDMEGRLYSSFKTYKDIPRDEQGNSLFSGIYAYCDTADEGKDYLCNIIFGVYRAEAYVLDVYYTKDGMEVTEPETAKRLHEQEVRLAYIESNNGGRGFARQVDRHLKEDFGNNLTKVVWFHQTNNKKARILSNATWVMDHVYFPVNWADRWPEYYISMSTYQREGSNKNDDAQDTTTGVAEIVTRKVGTRKKNRSGKGARA
jgi:predicted phage terminase large subunit-like protein